VKEREREHILVDVYLGEEREERERDTEKERTVVYLSE